MGRQPGKRRAGAAGLQPISPPTCSTACPTQVCPRTNRSRSTARGRRARRSRGRYIIYLLVLFVICLALAIPAVLLGGPLVQEWLVKTTPTSTVTETSLPVPTNTNTPEPTATSTSTSTATVTPSATPTQTEIRNPNRQAYPGASPNQYQHPCGPNTGREFRQ